MPPKKSFSPRPPRPNNPYDALDSEKDHQDPQKNPPDKDAPISNDQLAQLIATLCVRMDSFEKTTRTSKPTRISAATVDSDSDNDNSDAHTVIAPKAAGQRSKSGIRQNFYAGQIPKRQQVINVPPFEGRLESLYPNSILAFINRYTEYAVRNHIEDNLAYYMSTTTRIHARSVCFPHGTMKEFLSLDNEEIVLLLKDYVKPKHTSAWISTIRSSVKFPKLKYIPSVTKLQELFLAASEYTYSFVEMVDFLNYDDVDLLPELYIANLTQPSLVSLYLENFPSSLGVDLHQQWFPRMKTRAYPNIRAYTEAFLAKLREQEEFGKSVTPFSDICAKLVSKSKLVTTSPPISTLHAMVPILDAPITDDLYAQSSLLVPDCNGFSALPAHIDDETLDWQDDGGAIGDNSAPLVSVYDSAAYCEDCVTNPTHTPGSLATLQPAAKVCHAYLLDDICRNPKCQFSHDPAIIRRAREQAAKHLKTPAVIPAVPPRAPTHTAILPRPANGNPDYRDASVKKAPVYSAKGNINALLPHLGYKRKLSALPITTAHVQAVLHAGSATLPATALLDTGAVSDSYMSLSYYNQHCTSLVQHSFACSGEVTLGNDTTTCGIRCGVSIPVTFTYGTRNYHVDMIFLVYESQALSQDVIVGWPDLQGCCYYLLLDVLITQRAARMAAQSLDLEQPDGIDAPQQLDSITALQDSYIQPFSRSIEEAPEELQSPAPVSFGSFLNFMETSADEALAKYLLDIPHQCSVDMLSATPLDLLLRTKGKQVFCPTEWKGIEGIEIELLWKSNPPRRKLSPRHINPKLLEVAKCEFDRLLHYMYEYCDSEVVSPLVIAPKATQPFVRFCGGYVEVNRYIEVGHWPIPHVQKSLEKISKNKVFIDLDLANSFHQFRLADTTSNRLSIQTPWGQVRPLFLPEGVGPASFILQKHMVDIFGDFDSWSIVLFDNILLLADDFQDAYAKLEMFLDRCIAKNIILKFSKTWIGQTTVNFFGYQCTYGSYKLSSTRIQALLDTPFPASKKQMQSFLGASVFFQSFIPNFADLAAPLYRSTSDVFNWNDLDVTTHCHAPFEALKHAIANVTELYYPDYSLPWYLRTDASDLGCGGSLFQVSLDGQIQPILYMSHKFSDAATRWSVIARECYACFWCVQQAQYYLRCKEFVLQTDHRNLVWMESSDVPKIVRWCIFLQSFTFLVEHIPGNINRMADMLSRLHVLDSAKAKNISLAHGGRVGHNGVTRTMELLKDVNPDADVTMDEVKEFIRDCPVCQKFRLPAHTTIPPITKTLRASHARSVVAADTLSIAPDSLGNKYILVVINLFTRFVHLYPVADKTAKTTASCLFHYFSCYGLSDVFHSDPGSDFTSDVVRHLLQWLGVGKSITLVDNPQANGVERVNAEIIRHLRALVADERVADRWSDPTVLCWIQVIMNSFVCSGSGYSPFDLMYGSLDSAYFNYPITSPVDGDEYSKQLSDNLQLIRTLSSEFQASLKASRESSSDPLAQTRYAHGDFVFYLLDNKLKRGNKLNAMKKGPYMVLQHMDGSNVVSVRNLVTDAIFDLNQKDLQIFRGTLEEAQRMAKLDDDQHDIDRILGYSGDPEKRSSLDFLVLFKDGDKLWLKYSPDIALTSAFEEYCSSIPCLNIVLLSLDMVSSLRSQTKRNPVDVSLANSDVYINLRIWGAGWYNSLNLPYGYEVDYVLQAKVLKVNGKKRVYTILLIVFNGVITVDSWFMHRHGGQRVLKQTDVLVTQSLCQEFKIKPKIQKSSSNLCLVDRLGKSI